MPYAPPEGWELYVERAGRTAETALTDALMMLDAGVALEESVQGYEARIAALERTSTNTRAAVERVPLLCRAGVAVPVIAAGKAATLTGAWSRRPSTVPSVVGCAVIPQGLALGTVARVTATTLAGCTVAVEGPVSVSTGSVLVLAAAWA